MTNGEKIKEIFPGTKIITQYDNQFGDRFMIFTLNKEHMQVNIDWWNAEYKEPITEEKYEYVYIGNGAYEKRSKVKSESTAKNDLEVQKAIEIIKADDLAPYSIDEILSARDLAVEALKQMTTTNLGVDCISRADVNQVIKDYMDEQYHALSDRTRERASGAKVVMARINELSSVTPQPCEDAVSRKAVLEMAKSYNADGWDMYTPLVVDVEDIEELPSVTPQEPRKGYWILTDVEGDRVWHCNCSECGKDPQDYIGGSEDWWLIRNNLPKFCPSCGSDNREVKE